MAGKDRERMRKYRMASRVELGIFAAVAALGSLGGGEMLDSPGSCWQSACCCGGSPAILRRSSAGSPKASGTLRGHFSANSRYIPTSPLGFFPRLRLYVYCAA